jgi:hypothetical protein
MTGTSAFIAFLVVLVVAPAIATMLKGRWAYLLAGILLSPAAWWVASVRLAKPTSFWARHFYGWYKMERSTHRFSVDGLTPEEHDRLRQRPLLQRVFNVDPERSFPVDSG